MDWKILIHPSLLRATFILSMRKKRVLVLMGGPSSEYKISLASGKNVLEALDSDKYIAHPFIIPRRGGLPTFPKADVAFIAMHGKYGEDGTIQAILEAFKIPYTGSGVLASALAMDKPRASEIFKAAGLNVPEFEVLRRSDPKFRWQQILNRSAYAFPLVAKPADQGSSIGVSIVKNSRKLKEGIHEAFCYSDRVIIQKFIKGREITCGVLEADKKILFRAKEKTTRRGGNKNKTLFYARDKQGMITDASGRFDLIALPPTEIHPQKGAFYNYRSKYDACGSKHITPPNNLSQKMIKTIQEAACLAHQVIGCSGMSRSDFILGEDGQLYILELNTIPGMTATSLLPEAAQKAGISFTELVDLLIENAFKRHIL